MPDKIKVLDKALIERAFGIMGRDLSDQKRFAEICVFGGSALIFLYDWRKVSGDVDVVIRSGEHHGAIRRATMAAARELGLEDSWLNDGVTQYANAIEERDFSEIGVYPSYERPALRVLGARPPYVLALKVMAMGDRSTPDDRDFHDAAGIAAEMGLATPDEIMGTVKRYFPTQPIPPLAEGRMDELAEAARARRPIP
jgi:hypothetical protein